MSRISVAIPCYEMGGEGANCLRHSFGILDKQTFKDFDVVITDHSTDNEVRKVCLDFENTLCIKYYRNSDRIGSPTVNTNLGIEKSGGEIIKFLCQDDFLYDENSLQIISDSFSDDDVWVATSYVHSNDRKKFYRKHTPAISDNVYLINLLGTPSAFAVRGVKCLLFDENLVWAYDVDFYGRMIKRYGNPKIIDDITMVNYLWGGQVTNTLANRELRKKENQYVLEKANA
jgi:glycosyltransferase involved in cell wall biosynthesis